MDLQTRIGAFSALGDILRNYHFDPGKGEESGKLDQAIYKAMQANQWFTADNLNSAVSALAEMLSREKLEQWLSAYVMPDQEPLKTVAVIMAGNIPLVGFHDFLCVLITGNKILGKLSSDDQFLLPAIADILIEIQPGFKDRIILTTGKIRQFEAVIATGSNNTASYFEYYFSSYPHIIRKNRNASAVLHGDETPEELSMLSEDVFSYFGMGCRNVSKLFLPEGFDMNRLPGPFHRFSEIIHHHKYNNNYTYQRSILSLNKIPYLDTGYVILKEDPAFTSPVGVVHYEFYTSEKELEQYLTENQDKIQCVVSSKDFPFRHVEPGKAQHPELADYADGVDTLKFLLSLIK